MTMTSKTMIAAAMLAAIVWTSSEDSYEEQRAAKHYANMVCEGSWPDYKNQKPECN